ncbi:4-hydroxy-2-oxoheptanedioate aldolase [soil metagenome]
MTRNILKAGLRERRRLAGFWLSLGSPAVAELAAQSGIDWLLIDMEHAPTDLAEVADQLRAAQAGAVGVAVRLPFSEPVIVKRLLDIGAQNLMFPMIGTAEEARAAVSWTRYPPGGIRGISATVRANAYGRQKDYLARYSGEQCVIVQVETPQAMANIPEIAAVEGVDAVFIGPGDLAASMGHAGDPAAPEVQAAIAEGVERIHAAGLPAGILGYGEAAARAYFDLGCEFVAIGGDTWLLARSMDGLAEAFVDRTGR